MISILEQLQKACEKDNISLVEKIMSTDIVLDEYQKNYLMFLVCINGSINSIKILVKYGLTPSQEHKDLLLSAYDNGKISKKDYDRLIEEYPFYSNLYIL